jgi:hypothetical protein
MALHAAPASGRRDSRHGNPKWLWRSPGHFGSDPRERVIRDRAPFY